MTSSRARLNSSRNFSKFYSRETIFTCAALTVSIKSRLAFTKIGSVGVRADSIHVTRVISFTFVNIWETTYIFALHYVCHFKNERTLSRVITLIIIHNKTVFLFFVFYELDIWNVYFITNISVYQTMVRRCSRKANRTIKNIVAKKLNSPEQFCPFPVYPAWHWHACDPRVFMHVAFTWQEWFPLHSLISVKS